MKFLILSYLVSQKKRKTHQDVTEEEVNKVPHSFVMHRGDVGKSVLKLEMDIRRVMEPYTASKLKVITTAKCDNLCTHHCCLKSS